MRTRRLRLLATGALLLIPLALIALRILSWVRLGVDYPYTDDWRALTERELGVFDLGIFFAVANDTLYPVGRFLDWVAHVTLGSNVVVYQAVSMLVVLGLVLVLQFVLLRRVLVSSVLAAAVAVLTILGLRAGDSYWGLANLGYQQALPVLCLLGILVVATWRRPNRIVVFGLTLLLALVAGFAYISGAFAVLAAGLAMLVAGWFIHGGLRAGVLAAGAGAVVGGAVTSVAQLVATMTGSGESSLAMPWDLDVWRLMLGILADSLLFLPADRPTFSFAVVAAAVALAVVVGVVLAVRVVRGSARRRERILAVVYLSLGVAIVAYLGIVAMGRLETVRGSAGGTDAFVLGWERFYQWWPTVFWPWLVAAGAFLLRRPARRRASVRGGLAVVAAVAAVLFAGAVLLTDEFDYDARHESLAQRRDAIARCVSQTLASSEPVVCQGGRRWDLAGAVLWADHVGSTFTHDLQLAPVAGGGVVLGRLGVDGIGEGAAFEPGGSATVTPSTEGYVVSGSARHAWRFTPADETGLAECSVLEVRAEVFGEGAEDAFVRYRPLEDESAGAQRQKARTLRRTGEVETVSVTVLAVDGFASPVTVLPAVGASDYTLADLAVVCHRPLGD